MLIVSHHQFQFICKTGTSKANKILQPKDWIKVFEKANTVFRTFIVICVNVNTNTWFTRLYRGREEMGSPIHDWFTTFRIILGYSSPLLNWSKCFIKVGDIRSNDSCIFSPKVSSMPFKTSSDLTSGHIVNITSSNIIWNKKNLLLSKMKAFPLSSTRYF